MKKLQVLFDALDFAKFSDRAIGNHFVKTLERIDDDLVEKEYEPSSEAEEAMNLLEAEIKDAIEQMAEEELDQIEAEPGEDPEAPMDDELISELDAEEVEEDDETSTLDDEDEVEKE